MRDEETMMAADNGPVEASAEMRSWAANVRQMHVALVEQGFSDVQAIMLLGQVMAAVSISDPDE